MFTIRPEKTADVAAIAEVIRAAFTVAFGKAPEADLVNALREHGKSVVSLVAELDGKIVGHILFSEITIEDNPRQIKAIGLAPLAVAPTSQRRGIGAQLTDVGIAACRAAGYEAMFVLGHPEYYPRFGFQPASRWGIKSEYDVRDEHFMALELTENALADCSGIARYQPEFNEL
jgi:putative acetyltransferase